MGVENGRDTAQRYFANADVVTSERWNQQYFYGCGLTGEVERRGQRLQFRIDLSGAGAIYSNDTSSPVDVTFRCDMRCRAASRWRPDQVDIGQEDFD